ncbi:MAG: OmpA family protein [bacterium]|nr:OmpA family protein [bacterium]
MNRKFKKTGICILALIQIFIALSCASYSRYSEYSPTISADGKTLIYQSDMGQKNQYKIYLMRKTKTGWGQPVLLENINSESKDGGPFITYDQNALIFSSNRPGGKGYLDLWISRRDGKNWTEPVNMGEPINSSGYDGFASLSPDGKVLYYVRECKDKKKYKDEQFGIYFSVKKGGKWTKPQRMPAPVNSEYCEFGPIISADGRSLIFSSTRPGGLGGYDLYKTDMMGEGKWSIPVNLGRFVNTEKDDALVTVPASGEIMFHPKANWRDKEIYRINVIAIPPEMQNSTVIAVSGTIYDKTDPSKSIPAKITITDINNSTEPITMESNKVDGSYIVILNKGKIYDVSVSCDGYTFQSTKFDVRGLEKYKEIEKNIMLEPIMVGATFVLNNIYFELRSFELMEESKYELDRIIKILKENPSMKIEISGHTDSKGKKSFNLKLSQKRADSVVAYLVQQGVPNDRLTPKGYGSEHPLVSNKNKKLRKQNRRVEMKILGID